MAGAPESSQRLNDTLCWIVDLMDKNSINDWFVSYGTLLGLIRDGSCIDGDDDIDICINFDHWDDIYDPLKKKNILTPNEYYIRDNFMCTRKTQKYGQVDFYLCNVTEDGDFIDTWEDVTWSGCYNDGELHTIEFCDRKVNIPHNAVEKLSRRYGSTWNQRIKRGTEAGDGYRKVKVL